MVFFYPPIVEYDCLKTMNLVNNQEYSFIADGIIVSEIQDLLSQMNILEIYYRPRESNMVAHIIVKFIVQRGGLFFWLEERRCWLMICLSSLMHNLFFF